MTNKVILPWDITPEMKGNGILKRTREQPGAPYHTSRWTKLSRAIREERPLCAECQRRGILRPATCVDHLTPWPICGESGFFDRANLQPLCDDCNNRKGIRDRARIQAWKRAHPGWEGGTGGRITQPVATWRKLDLKGKRR